jgi:hypothetical protein
LLAVFCAVAPPPSAAGDADGEVVTLERRGDARLRILVLRPEGVPNAAVLLYPGGNGGVGIRRDGSLKHDTNFLVRSRALFVKQGLLTVVVDRPSDWAGADKTTYRLTKAHVADAAAIAKAVRALTPVPIWFVGTSRGTISVAGIASRLGGDLIAGAVFTSSVTRVGRRASQTIHDVDLAGIRVPVLVLGHVNDDCAVTPWPEQLALAGKFRNAAVVESIRIEGGEAGNYATPCGPISHHGFLGQEEAVVARIADWIRGHRQKR